jgi:hypothetical protein
VNSVARAKFFEELGADSITLDFNINRDFRTIKAIRSAVKIELNLLLNDACLFQCPFRYYHYNLLGHSSQPYNPLHGFYIEYPTIRCTIARYSDISQFIKSRWVRPEDLHIYEESGIDSFKVSGRTMSTEWILNTAKAYSSGEYKGNLAEILQVIDPASGGKYANPRSALARTMMLGDKLARHEELMRASGEPNNLPYLSLWGLESFRSFIEAKPPHLYIDNQALDGFLDVFPGKDCLSECAHCNYCHKIAEKAVRLDRQEADEYIAILKRFLDDLTTSRVFRYREKEER